MSERLPERTPLLRRSEQAVLATLVAVSLIAMTAAWLLQGGHRGRLIEIDQVDPIQIAYEVDINTASWPELAQLPQIGETLARRIVVSRKDDGPFRDHDDLLRVRGIGPKTLDGIRPYLRPMQVANAVVEN